MIKRSISAFKIQCTYLLCCSLLSFKTIFAVNSISWAPPEYGLMLACGSSDGSVSIISSSGENCKDWQTSEAFTKVLV